MITSYRDVGGWMDYERTYVEFVNKSPQGKVYFCEVGTWLGRSTAFLGELVKLLRIDAKIYAIDSFEGDKTTQFQTDIVREHGGSIFDTFWQNMRDLKVDQYIIPIKSISWEAPALIPPEISFFFTFLDADHKYESISRDIEAYWPRVAKGGLLSGHDYTDGVLKAVHEFAQKNNLKVYRDNMVWIIPKE